MNWKHMAEFYDYLVQKNKEFKKAGFVPTIDLLIDELDEHDCKIGPLGEGACTHPSHPEGDESRLDDFRVTEDDLVK